MKEIWKSVIVGVILGVLGFLSVSAANVHSNHESRIAVLEAQYRDFHRRLDRLETKIDRVLEAVK